MARVSIRQQQAVDGQGTRYNVAVEELSGPDFPGYLPQLPDPGTGTFITITDEGGTVKHFERCGSRLADERVAAVLLALGLT